MPVSIVDRIAAARVIPVIALDTAAEAVPLAQALVRGGLPVLEVTFRTDCAAEAIARIRDEVPAATPIAGTVLTASQLHAAQAAGAQACVAPGFDPEVIRAAQALSIPFCPGVATASELTQALSLGCRFVKFFPAEAAGGTRYLRDLLGAFRQTGIRFMPTGGVNLANLGDYLAIPEVACCGGTWVAPRDAVRGGDWTRIERLAGETAALAAKVRS